MNGRRAEDRIEEFFDCRGELKDSSSFYVFDPDNSFTYIFKPTKEGISLLINRIRGPGIRRHIAVTAFKSGTYAPSALRALPGVSKTTLSVPADGLDLVIASHRQIKLLAPKRGIAATIGWPSESRVSNEIGIRRTLPDDINHPRLLDVDESFPYFVSEFVKGGSIDNPVKNWKYIQDGLRQLRSLYLHGSLDFINKETVIDEIRTDLCDLRDDPVIREHLMKIDSLRLPEQFGQSMTHGDYHGGNLRITPEKEVYILDWEHADRHYLYRDFILAFLQWARYGGTAERLDDLLKDSRPGKCIGVQYANTLGDLAWDEKTWYSDVIQLGLLRELVVRSRDGANWDQTYNVLKKMTAG